MLMSGGTTPATRAKYPGLMSWTNSPDRPEPALQRTTQALAFVRCRGLRLLSKPNIRVANERLMPSTVIASPFALPINASNDLRGDRNLLATKKA